MALVPGSRIGPYEVAGPLGSGGMGEVYRARDTKLGRDVALKILPPAFAGDADRVARFRREALLLASLNHQNIASIYGLEEATGTTALVLELVEGPTLADRLKQGALALNEALGLARQIADALEAAHEKGIIHRDLKPANIKITPDGQVKVLDFGLAKMLESEAAPSPLSMSPTLSAHATNAGVILGTAAYMSPEQARGRPVDRRADIWAFGCVLYEMLTATRAFAGEDLTDTFAAIVRGEPEWSTLPAETPPAIRQLLRRCLEKDPKERLPSIGSARLEIKDVMASSSSSGFAVAATQPVARRRRGKAFAWIAAAVALVGAAAVTAAWSLRARPVEPTLYRSSILPPDKVPWAVATPATRFALSPDGRRLAFLATGADSVTRIRVRQLDALVAQPLGGTEGAVQMFWSPDSRRLAFGAGGRLRIISASGGPPIAIADVAGNNGGSWSQDDVILFEPTQTSAIHRISASGGTPGPVTELDRANLDVSHWQPFFLPDGRHFLHHITASKSQPNGAVYVGSIDGSAKPKLLLQGGSNAQYALGYILFMRDATLMAQRFDPDHLEVRGDAIPIAEQVQVGGSTGRTGAFSVSQTGALVYQTGAAGLRSRLTWYDRSGRDSGTLSDAADYGDVELSPDGNRVAVSLLDSSVRTRDIWIFDVKRGLRTRFTFDPGDELQAIWSPDGSRLVFASRAGGPLDLFQKPATGSGGNEKVYGDGSNKLPTSWSPDGRSILFSTARAGSTDIWMLPIAGDRPSTGSGRLEPAEGRKPVPLLQTPFLETNGRFSPDGRWIAYSSNESGRNEIYVAPASGQAGKWQVSTAGGGFPRWRRDVKELFYLAPDNKLMAAEVNSQASGFDVGVVRALFETRPKGGLRYAYDVTGDGQRFLVNSVRDDPSPEPLTLVVNWTAELKK